MAQSLKEKAPIPLDANHRQKSNTVSTLSDGDNNQPLIIKKPLSISREFDLVLEQHKAKDDDGIDRSEWLNRLLQLHPEIKTLRESVNPIARAATFGRLYLPPNRYIPHDVLLALISQHLRTLGLTETQAALHQEWGSDFNIPPHKQYSQLSLLVQRGIYRAEKFWELAIPSVHAMPNLKLTQAALDEAISTTIGASSTVAEDQNPIEKEIPYDPEFYKVDEKQGGQQPTPASPTPPTPQSIDATMSFSDPAANEHVIPDTEEQTDSSKNNQERVHIQPSQIKEPVEASLNQIIFYVTDPTITNASELLNALILTIQSYASSKVFFTKIRDRIRMTMKQLADLQQKNASKGEISIAERSVRLSIRLFKEWMKSVINDLEPQILDSAKQFVESELMGKYSTHVANMFDKKQDPLRLQMLKNAAPVDIGMCQNLWTGDFELFDLPVGELARQLTFWSYTRYYAIRRVELLDCAWEKPRLKYRAPNVIALTQHYNHMSHWVENSILQEPGFKKRMDRFHYIIQLMQELYKMNNFLDMAGIVGGFDSNAIYRLKFHYSQLSQQEKDFVEQMKVLCSPDKNFANIRKKQDDALLSNKPALPYIGALLSDLFKYDDAVALFINGLINCRKMKGLYNFISKIEEFKRSMYCFLSIDQVQEKISNLTLHDEELLYIISKDVEKDQATSMADVKDQPRKE